MNNIILIGFMGSGKTSVAIEIASKTDYLAVDTDKLVEEKCRLTIPQIFKYFGEEYFRKSEQKIAVELLTYPFPLVIATGGGLPCYRGSYEILKRLGKIFFLKNSKNILLKRILNDSNRPLRLVNNLFEKRQHFYETASDYVISCDFKSTIEIAEEILLLKNY